MYSIEHVVMDIINTNFYWVQIIHNSRGLLSVAHVCTFTSPPNPPPPPSEFFPYAPREKYENLPLVRGCIYLDINLNFLYLLSNTQLVYITLKKAA